MFFVRVHRGHICGYLFLYGSGDAVDVLYSVVVRGFVDFMGSIVVLGYIVVLGSSILRVLRRVQKHNLNLSYWRLNREVFGRAITEVYYFLMAWLFPGFVDDLFQSWGRFHGAFGWRIGAGRMAWKVVALAVASSCLCLLIFILHEIIGVGRRYDFEGRNPWGTGLDVHYFHRW